MEVTATIGKKCLNATKKRLVLRNPGFFLFRLCISQIMNHKF